MAFKLKKRCVRCLKVLREDGTCQNPNCVLYVDEQTTDTTGTVNTGTNTSETAGNTMPGEVN